MQGVQRQLAAMSLLAMPMVIINLGSEMMYILEQRLKAQNIPPDKASKVLNDVARTMFDKEYMEKLFTPQELYSVSSVRKIFDRLAHSSIMRLSESSMDKLFDLMMMGLKYQLMCSTKLEALQQITQLHLSQLKSMLTPLPDSQASLALIAAVDALVAQTYTRMGQGQLHLLRQTLQRFFQDKRVKVSLFLQEGIQSTIGRLILPSPASPYVGTVTYYDGRGGLEGQEKIKLRCQEFDPQEFFIHPVPLGTNLYNKDRPKVVPPPRKGDALQAPVSADDMGLPGEGKSQYAEDVLDKGLGRGARQELSLLSALLNIKTQTDNFKLNLFGQEEGLGAGAGQKSQGGVPSYSFEGQNQYKAGMLAALRLDDAGAKGKSPPGGAKTEEEDLLDLLDR